MSALSRSGTMRGRSSVITLPAKPRPSGDPPAGEAAAGGDARSLLDLLLDPLGRPRHQLARLVVEEENGHGVRREDRLDPVEKRPEEVVEGEVGERRLAEGLEGAGLPHPPGAGGARLG